MKDGKAFRYVGPSCSRLGGLLDGRQGALLLSLVLVEVPCLHGFAVGRIDILADLSLCVCYMHTVKLGL